MKVVVLGASGMLGSMVLDYLSRDSSLELIATTRSQVALQKFRERVADVEWRLLDSDCCSVREAVTALGNAPWAVNAIGVIKPYIHDDNAVEVVRAVRTNALFPHVLAQAAEQSGCRLLQIATDCVYSGRKGCYTEPESHDATDVYGKTKSLGEAYSPKVHHLRCSIIGPEPKSHVSLLDWFLGQPRNGGVNGYTNHKWNGVTTMHFARLCHGVITHEVTLPHLQHAVPSGMVSKVGLLQCFAREYGREDITIVPTEAKTVIDRTLGTTNELLNRRLWAAAGYAEPPSVPQMVAELARFDYRLGGLPL